MHTHTLTHSQETHIDSKDTLQSDCMMAPDDTVTSHAKTSALHPQDFGGDARLSHTPVLHLSAPPVVGAQTPLTSSSIDDDFLPSALAPVHSMKSTAMKKKVENFPPRRPLKLAPIELPLEVKEGQRQKLHSIWKEAENLELSVKKVSGHGKAILQPVNQITVSQWMVKKELDHHALEAKLLIHTSQDLFQTHQNMPTFQSARGKMNAGQSHVRGSKLRRVQQLDPDQSKSNSSTEGLKDDKGKPAASGAALCQKEGEKVLEKSLSRNPVRKVSEAVVGRGSKKMAVYGTQTGSCTLSL